MTDHRDGKIVAMYDQATFDRLIPQEAIKLLPLKPEPINIWQAKNLDSVEFIKHICDKDSYVTYPDGHREKVNYKSFWKTLYQSSLKKFKLTAKQFYKEATKHSPVPASTIGSVKIPDFLADNYFGSVAKYYSCYAAIINGALSENHFFSISHLMESQEEMECSILLAQNLYYKQALQVLRNFIELLVCQLLFCWDSKEFENWRNGNFRLPRLRGKGGLLDILLKANQISSSLSQRTAKTYDTLNSYIHSSERNLIHRGQYKGQYKGYIFDYDYFNIWCRSFSDIIEHGIMLLEAHFEQLNKLNKEGLNCSICHNQKGWEIYGEHKYAGVTYIDLKCTVCSNIVTLNKSSIII